MSDKTKRANMEDFFKTVGEVRVVIETISSQVEEVERRHGVILSNPNKEHRNKEELEKLNSDITRNSNVVRARLKSIQKSLLLEEGGKVASVIQRIHKNQHSHLTLCFVDVMRSYYRAQIDFREKCKARIQRQLEIVNKVTTDEELEDMLNGDNPEIFISDIKSESRLSSQALNEIESRHHDILSLEFSIRELHEIFADVALLVEIQGELVNNIEKNVMSAAEYVDMSKEECSKAVAYKKNPYKIASLPSFFKPFKRVNSAKTVRDQSTPNLNHSSATV